MEPLHGRSEIVAFLGGVTGNVAAGANDTEVKPIVRHNVANVLFSELAAGPGPRLVVFHRRHPYRTRPFRPLPRHFGA